MAMTDDRERKAAEAKFKKSERANNGAQAMSEYKADGDAERAKTARLKALGGLEENWRKWLQWPVRAAAPAFHCNDRHRSRRADIPQPRQEHCAG
jgi:hypothetical protein